jgi:hypothetical protein
MGPSGPVVIVQTTPGSVMALVKPAISLQIELAFISAMRDVSFEHEQQIHLAIACAGGTRC